jgi:hypothetical protein
VPVAVRNRLTPTEQKSGREARDLMSLRQRPQVQALGLIGLFSAVGMLMMWPSIGNPWFWDDLHWFRYYPLHQLASTWVGNTDPLGLMVPGFRPLHAISNFLRYELFRESPDANRYLTMTALVAAFSLFVAAFRRLGVPVLITIPGALLAITSKNLTYTYAWASDGYQGLQMAAFAACLFTAVKGLQTRRRPRFWLAMSAFLWLVTLFLKDQGVLLVPALVLVAFLAALGGFPGLANRVDELTAGSLMSASKRGLAHAWRHRTARPYVVAVVVLAVGDAIARSVLVPQATPATLSLKWLALGLVEAVSFAGHEDSHGDAALYTGFACVLFFFLVFVGLRSRLRTPHLIVPWLVAAFAAIVVAFSSLYGLDFARQDIADFPILFYGIFVSATVLLAVRMLERHRRSRTLLIAGVSALALVSVTASIRASVGVQRAMSSSSVQTLGYDYTFVYGSFSSRAAVPMHRKAKLEATLAHLGIKGPLSAPTSPQAEGYFFPDSQGYAYLYCKALANRSFPAMIPKLFAWGHKAFPPVACSHGRVVLIG